MAGLDDSDEGVRQSAIHHFGRRVAAGDRSAVDGLLKGLQDRTAERRGEAARCLGYGEHDGKRLPDDPRLLVAVRALLSDSNGGVRRDALGAFRLLAPAAESIAVFARLLSDRDWRVRSGAAFELGLIGPPAARAIRPLIARLSDRDEDVRRSASFALQFIGVPDPTAIAELTRKARASGGRSAAEAFETLIELAPR